MVSEDYTNFTKVLVLVVHTHSFICQIVLQNLSACTNTTQIKTFNTFQQLKKTENMNLVAGTTFTPIKIG